MTVGYADLLSAADGDGVWMEKVALQLNGKFRFILFFANVACYSPEKIDK